MEHCITATGPAPTRRRISSELGPLHSPYHFYLGMALLVKMGTGILLFACLVAAMAFVFSSCTASGVHACLLHAVFALQSTAVMVLCLTMIYLTDHCSPVVPCNATTCFDYCQKNNYKNFQTSCTPGLYYPICCCRVRGGAAGP